MFVELMDRHASQPKTSSALSSGDCADASTSPPETGLPLRVAVIDFDTLRRLDLVERLGSVGYKVAGFRSLDEHLQTNVEEADVVLYCVENREQIARLEVLPSDYWAPLIIVAAEISTKDAVYAMRRGAFNIVRSDGSPAELYVALAEAAATVEDRRAQAVRNRELRQMVSTLNPAQREVLRLLLKGLSNRAVAKILDIGLRTVENRRRELYERFGADSVVPFLITALEVSEAGLI